MMPHTNGDRGFGWKESWGDISQCLSIKSLICCANSLVTRHWRATVRFQSLTTPDLDVRVSEGISLPWKRSSFL